MSSSPPTLPTPTFVNPLVERYYHEYDDYDRYFDLIYDMYQHMCHMAEDCGLRLNSSQSFPDFYQLCLNHMDHQQADDVILSTSLAHLKKEMRKTPYQWETENGHAEHF